MFLRLKGISASKRTRIDESHSIKGVGGTKSVFQNWSRNKPTSYYFTYTEFIYWFHLPA